MIRSILAEPEVSRARDSRPPALRTPPPRYDLSRISDEDLRLFRDGRHAELHEKFGSHPLHAEGGTCFAVWAPHAAEVSVLGPFNDWTPGAHPLRARGDSGVWEGFLPGVSDGALYKYRIRSTVRDYEVDKADPFGRLFEVSPGTATVVRSTSHAWGDAAWMAARARINRLEAPLSIYELHLGSWRRDHDPFLTYRELAIPLAEHVLKLGFTHVEFLPVMEHPFYGSWGYQTTGYFAPTSRYGTPEDFMYLIDVLHQRGIGVILDWVPSHFPADAHGLKFFDGTHLFEHADPRRGHHPDWGSALFDYGRPEVRSFLTSNALFWLKHFHADGLRVDAVASMLYLDFSRKPGEWIPNEKGGRENLQAIRFLRQMNEEIRARVPDVQIFAEESAAWPGVSKPSPQGGLGFHQKWDLGWMHDTLDYLRQDPVHRANVHKRLTFRAVYAFNENFLLPLSHDEVVHGKGSLLSKMPGDPWRKFANLRLLLGCLFAQPGKKLLFMGGEFGQWGEWKHDESLDWGLAELPPHQGLLKLVGDLNRLYRSKDALHEGDFDPAGFEWVDCADARQSTISFLRRAPSTEDVALAVFNFTPVPRNDYRVGLPRGGFWSELLSSDAARFGGSGVGNGEGRESERVPFHGRPWSVRLSLPPLGFLLLEPGR